jgi:hypothetical protein
MARRKESVPGGGWLRALAIQPRLVAVAACVIAGAIALAAEDALSSTIREGSA